MIKDRAKDVLIRMGMPSSILGLKYIVDAMESFDSGLEDIKITALYKIIGEKYNASGSQVERSIRHAFGLVVTKGKLSEVEKYLSFNCTTNSNQLNLLYYRLKQEEKEAADNETPKAEEVIKINKCSDPYQDFENDMIHAIQKFVKNLREVSADACSKVG
jgi:hypothetical protein